MKGDRSIPAMNGGAAQARLLFPAGLAQPRGSFRFSADALLLAAFALRESEVSAAQTMLDLGCGCGVVAFAVLLRRPTLTAFGVDVQAPLVDAARQNARRLGLQERFTADVLDLESENAKNLPAAAFDLVAANPPYYQAGRGRLPASEARRAALFAGPDALPAFMRAAKRALLPGGRFTMIYPAAKLPEALGALTRCELAATRLLPVVSRPGKAPLRCLIAARHTEEVTKKTPDAVAQEPRREPPLVLFRAGDGKEYSPQSLDFCPDLAARPVDASSSKA